MDKELLMLSSKNDLDGLGSRVKSMTKDEMLQMVERIFTTEEPNFIKLLMALFKGLQSSPDSSPIKLSQTPPGSAKKISLYTTCVGMLATKDLSTKLSTDIVRLLVAEMETLPSQYLIKLSKDIIDYLKNAEIKSFRFLEILPKLLHLIQSQYSIPVDSGTVGGAEFKNSIVQKICSIKWNSTSLVHLASIFKEIHLPQGELQSVICKCLKYMDSMDVQEIPPLVYQLLILSSKGCKNFVLDGIIQYFIKDENDAPQTIIDDSIDMIEDSALSQSQSTKAPSRLQQIEATVIYHVTFSIKQNQELGKEFIKYLKAYQHSGKRELLSSFVINLALSISKISSFESQVLDLLKQIVMYCFKDQRKKWESKWLRENSSPPYDVTDHVMSSIKQMLVEWDVVMEGLVAFGFSLMEVSPPKGCFGKPSSGLNTGCSQSSPVVSLNTLGVRILEECSKVHTNVATEIINQLINRIVTKGQDQVPSHFRDLVISLLKSSPHTYVENCMKFKDTFDYFSFLPLGTSRILLKALLPVVRISPSLKNGLILLLRKSLFSRHVEMRKVAVSGFLLLLKNFKVLTGLLSSQSQGSSSQVTADVHRNNGMLDSDNKSLCLEIVGSLRRCFGQQHDVRSLLYNGLCSVASMNPVLLGPIADLLLTQLKIYFDPVDANLPPLKMNLCISLTLEAWIAVEPLPDLIGNLIFCLGHLKKQNPVDGTEVEFIDRANAILDSITTRMINCDIDDFELESEFDASSTEGSKNVVLAQLIVGVYEVLLQKEVMCQDADQEKVELMLKLFQGLNKLIDASKDGEPNKKGKPKKVSSSSDAQKLCRLNPGSQLSLGFLVTVSKMMFEDDDISNLILSNNNFCNYFFNSATMLLQQFSSSSSFNDDFDSKFCSYAFGDQEKVISDLTNLGRLLLKRYIKVVIKPNNNDISIAPTAPNNNNNKAQANVTKTLNLNCLKVFHQVLSIFSKKWPNKTSEFLVHLSLLNKSTKKLLGKDPSEGPVLYIKMFQRIFFTLLTSTGELFSSKDRFVVMQCIVLMIDNCSKVECLVDCCNWFTRLFKEHVIDDSELLKLMLKELLILLRRTELKLGFVKDVCRDIHLCLGDVNQEVELDSNSSNLPTVNHKSSAVIIQSVISHLELEIEDSEWLIGQMKSQSIGTSRLTSFNLTEEGDEVAEFEKTSPCGKAVDGQQLLIKDANRNLITRTSFMTDVFHELVQTKVPFGPSIEMVFKVLNKFYTLLCSYIKLYIWKYNHKSKEIDIVVAGPFEKLIKSTATQLTRFVYPMISHVEKVENEKLQAENEKHKNKKSKKKNNAQTEKVKKMKETKLIPSLILNLEQYEQLLIQLSKKSKVNLMAHFKLSTSRDFRINTATLQGLLENRGNDGDDRDDDDDDDEDDNDKSASRSRGSGANSALPGSDDENVDDVEAEIASLLRDGNDSGDGAVEGGSDQDDVEDCGTTAPPKKRAKLGDALPRKKKIPDRKKK